MPKRSVDLPEPELPVVRDVPRAVRGFVLRLDLDDAEPPVWRRLELPGDLRLSVVHDVIQAAMGWYDAHLHRFRTGREPWSPGFVSRLDVAEGEAGVLEDDIRLDQVVGDAGDELWYAYDFGDGWDHRLVVETVLDASVEVRCTAGERACPPEDCGGMPGYEQLVAWHQGGRSDALLPDGFDSRADAEEWLPAHWDPTAFDVDETSAAVAAVVAEPVAVVPDLAALQDRLEQRGIRVLRELLARPASHGPTEVDEVDAGRLVAPYAAVLDIVRDGVQLTAAGYLPPSVVEEIATRTGVASWWIGKANREDLTPPIALLRASMQALGLVTARKGRLAPTAAARKAASDPRALLAHVLGRLPLGRRDHERDSGWVALAVVGSGTPQEEWNDMISAIMLAIGWRVRGTYGAPPADSGTLNVLEQLSGALSVRRRSRSGVDEAVAAAVRGRVVER